MNIQQAVDAPRFHHQWLPDKIVYERHGISPDTIAILNAMGHQLQATSSQGIAEAIFYDLKRDLLEGAWDRRAPDGAAVAP
jgi:gamma-glutamyltranspeptidase/glutathione hydrolase